MPEQPWTVGRLLGWTADYFRERGGGAARLDAEVLLAHALSCKRIELYTRFDEAPPDAVRAEFKRLVQRRAAGEPVAYLVGRKEFYSLEFEVTPDVLIPRPETEQLVLVALDWLKARGAGTHGDVPSVVDVGVGSGAIAVALAKHAHKASVTAIDKSPAALAVAKRNAARHGVEARVAFIQSDLFAAAPADARFDLVVSNPPYVKSGELPGLDADVREYEPRLALDGGVDGVRVVEPLVYQAAERLTPGGAILLEVGPSTAEAVERILASVGRLALQQTLSDLSGHARIVRATRSR